MSKRHHFVAIDDKMGINSIHFASQTRLPVTLLAEKNDVKSINTSLKTAKIHDNVKIL
jgi:hypothetical protein